MCSNAQVHGDLDLLLFGKDLGGGVLRLDRNDTNSAPPPSIYCTAKLNSLGCLPALGSIGLSSVSSTSQFTIHASPVINRQNGILFYRYSQTSSAFQGGFKCMANPTVRTPIQSSIGSASSIADCSGA